MRNPKPDFLVIGAMKSATSTLHHQLSRQPGLFLSQPKEPNFFSDDDVFSNGPDWYGEIFRHAPAGSLRGESSTHYSKRPTYPKTVERISAALPDVKILYVMRHPLDRMISHYRHDRNVGVIHCGLKEAIEHDPELLDYGRYAYQLTPYLECFERAQILPVFFERLVQAPGEEFERIGRFLGVPGSLRWDTSLKPQNVTSERLKRCRFREALVRAPLLTPLRRRLVPKALTDQIKVLLKENPESPEISREFSEHLTEIFDADLDRLGEWLGIALNCENFSTVTRDSAHEWVANA